MPIEPINAITEVPAQSLPTVHAPASQTAGSTVQSEAAQANQLAVIEQMAAVGDPQAVIQLAKHEQRLTPIDAELLLPTLAQHVPGAHEAGKGDLVDIYD